MTRKKLSLLLTLLLCMILCTISVSAFDTSDLTIPDSAEAITYGQSGAGRDLTAYRFGSGKNVMVVGFALHGFEDNFNQDGGALVYTADLLMELLDENLSTVNNYGWTIYVLPCMNPDGLMDGTTCNGPGRCTTTYLDSNGNLVTGKGVDLNRCFPTGWTQYTSARNFNGSAPLASLEARALARFIEDVQGSGSNLCIDVHGWMSQIITSNGSDSSLYKTFKSAFSGNTYANCNNGKGYFTAYAASLGYAACLFEFPSDVTSMSYFRKSGYAEEFNSCILKLAQVYGTYTEPEPEPEPEPDHDCASLKFTDVSQNVWYHDAVDFVVQQGIMNGVSATRFAPEGTLSRAMLTTILYRMSGETATQPSSFIDDPGNAYYSEALSWAETSGVVQGFDDGTFRPDAAVTREQMVTMFHRYAMYTGADVAVDASLSAFADAHQVQDYAKDAFTWATAVGLIQGFEKDGVYTLQPQGISTRAQTAAVIQRYYGLIPSGTELISQTLTTAAVEANLPADGEDLGGN